jgi:hypothetical protein
LIICKQKIPLRKLPTRSRRLRAAQAYSKETWEMQAKEIERLRREHEKTWADAALKDAEIERLSTDYDLLSDDYKQLVVDNKRLCAELDGADRIANGWARQNVELRRLLRFFFENVPVSYHEGYADVMKRAKEMLGHDA